MGKSSRIKERLYYAVDIRLHSPLCVSSGENDFSDKDVLQNARGEVFVPGTSLAGAFRNYIDKKKEQNSPFGYPSGEEGRMSSIIISDLYFEQKEDAVRLCIRDGVQLTDEKSVANKFDMQVIETGAKGTFYIECVERENDTENSKETIQKVLIALQNGEIRLGASKNRGYGKLEILAIRYSSFSSEQLSEWLEFRRQERDRKDSWNKPEDEKKGENKAEDTDEDYYKEVYSSYQIWRDSLHIDTEPKYITVRVPLKLEGGISIRRYSANPEKVDFEQLTVGSGKYERAVIPGTSWNGAIRGDVKEILNAVQCKKADDIMKMWFGWCGEGRERNDARQSMLVIGESKFEGARPLTIVRNKIDRFTGGTVKTALYSERVYVDGSTELVYMIRKDEENESEYKALIAMMELAVQDIQNGYVAIGGQVSVGKGIFSRDEGKEITYSESVDMEECRGALYELVKGVCTHGLE